MIDQDGTPRRYRYRRRVARPPENPEVDWAAHGPAGTRATDPRMHPDGWFDEQRGDDERRDWGPTPPRHDDP